MKSNVSKETKDADALAAKLQTLCMDVVAPLVHILEEVRKGTLTPKVATKVAKIALSLLGNASAHQAKERMKTILNRDILPLAEEDDMFKEAPPLLFGDGFEKKMKEHIEAVCCLQKTTGRATDSGAVFRRGHPQDYGHHHRGGSNHRRRSGHHTHTTKQAEKRMEPTRRSLSSNRTPSEESKNSRRN